MPFNHHPYPTEYQEIDERVEQEFDKLLSSSRSAYTIPRSAFDGYRVKRGLREADGTGVMAGVTRVGSAHGYVVSEGDKYPVEGVLEYRGYDLRDLIHNFAAENRFGFEETTFLLFFGHLPTREELAEFNDLLATLRRLPPRFTEDIIMKAPSRSIMNKLQTAVLSLYAYDDNPDEVSLDNMLRQSIEIVARLPVIAAQSYSVYRNAFFNKSLTLHNPQDHLSTAENFLRVLRSDKKYTEAEAHLLDLCLVIHAEHGGGNCSTFTTRVLTSSHTDTYATLSAAIGSLKGPRHGGANLKVSEMLNYMMKELPDIEDDTVKDYLAKIVRKEAADKSGLIYGMGHAVYTISDPRAVCKGFAGIPVSLGNSAAYFISMSYHGILAAFFTQRFSGSICIPAG